MIVTKGRATWVELQRDLSVDDVFDLLEIIEVETTLEEAAGRDDEIRQRQNNRR